MSTGAAPARACLQPARYCSSHCEKIRCSSSSDIQLTKAGLVPPLLLPERWFTTWSWLPAPVGCSVMVACSCCVLACSAVRDAAIECLEEVYKVYGEQLMDVLSSHQLRPAHLNLIYNRLAQMGAEVEQTPEQSCEGMRGRQLGHQSAVFPLLPLPGWAAIYSVGCGPLAP